jgi:hypothetical protein
MDVLMSHGNKSMKDVNRLQAVMIRLQQLTSSITPLKSMHTIVGPPSIDKDNIGWPLLMLPLRDHRCFQRAYDIHWAWLATSEGIIVNNSVGRSAPDKPIREFVESSIWPKDRSYLNPRGWSITSPARPFCTVAQNLVWLLLENGGDPTCRGPTAASSSLFHLTLQSWSGGFFLDGISSSMNACHQIQWLQYLYDCGVPLTTASQWPSLLSLTLVYALGDHIVEWLTSVGADPHHCDEPTNTSDGTPILDHKLWRQQLQIGDHVDVMRGGTWYAGCVLNFRSVTSSSSCTSLLPRSNVKHQIKADSDGTVYVRCWRAPHLDAWVTDERLSPSTTQRPKSSCIIGQTPYERATWLDQLPTSSLPSSSPALSGTTLAEAMTRGHQRWLSCDKVRMFRKQLYDTQILLTPLIDIVIAYMGTFFI